MGKTADETLRLLSQYRNELTNEFIAVPEAKERLLADILECLPEKRAGAVKQGDIIPFDKNHKVEMDWLRKTQDAGFNEAIEQMKLACTNHFRGGDVNE